MSVGVVARARRRARRGYNRMLFGALRLLFPTDVRPVPVPGPALRRVLVMANYFVGDLVVATPALSYLRAAAPEARIDVLVSPRSASLLDGDARVDRVLVHDPRRDGWLALAQRLRRERYDLVADFVLPHHLREGLLTAYVAGRRGARVTSHRPVRFAGFFTHRGRVAGFERRYMADRLLYAVRAAVAAPRGASAAFPLAVRVAPEAERQADAHLAAHGVGRFVALNAWASAAVRTLDVAQAAAVAAGIVAQHPALWVVLTPPPGADAAAAAIADAARARLDPADAARVLAWPSSPRLGDLVALLARAAVVVTPDTANVHLAAAVGRPTLALHTALGGTKLVHWTPPGATHRAVAAGRRPLSALPPATVLGAFDALWADVRADMPAELLPPVACPVPA